MTSTSRSQSAATTTGGGATGIRPYAILMGIATLLIFLQSFTAGEFVNQKGDGPEAWQGVHGILGLVAILFPLAAAIVALVRLRTLAPRLWLLTALLFALTVVQWVLGGLIAHAEQDELIVAHVVNAFLIYGLAIWLSVRSALLRRAAA
jgi:hypothetical protein